MKWEKCEQSHATFVRDRKRKRTYDTLLKFAAFGWVSGSEFQFYMLNKRIWCVVSWRTHTLYKMVRSKSHSGRWMLKREEVRKEREKFIIFYIFLSFAFAFFHFIFFFRQIDRSLWNFIKWIPAFWSRSRSMAASLT